MLNMFYKLFLCLVRPMLHRVGLDLVWYRRDSQDEAWERVLRYGGDVDSILPKAPAANREKVIWQFWWQGERNAPELVRHCMASVRRFAPAGWRVVVVDESNIDEFVDVPDSIRSKHDSGVISHTHFSDYLRASLLNRHGGIWIDSTVLLTGPVPVDILEAPFFMFKASLWADARQIPTADLLPSLARTAGKTGLGGGESAGSSRFLSSDGTSSIMNTVARLLETYWAKENALCDYFLFHKFLSLLICANDACRKEYVACPTYINVNPHLLLFSLDKPYDAKLWNQIKARTAIHKISYKASQPYGAGTFGEMATKGALS